MTPPDIHYKRSRFSTRLPWDRLYTASHFWVFEAEPGRWRVGLTKFAARMLEKGVYVIGFFYPVVPHGTARVRTQVSAAHSRADLEFAVNAFAETNDELK